jgi:choline dehydrogenase-like flavoprotein
MTQALSSIMDPIREGLARGWRVHGGGHAPLPGALECDVVIVGSGAGAGISAELLAKAGLAVVIVEEGPLKSSSDFNQRESEAYPQLYQESASRKTADKSIQIMQGRCVGGSTTVNWTSSFRTPPKTLAYWGDHFGLADYSPEVLMPWFRAAEQRLNIRPWTVAPNVNNDILLRGARKLGIHSAAISRNVKACMNLGSCGMGCPTNAKQSMLITTIPAALDRGAVLLVQTRAEQVLIEGDKAVGLVCVGVAQDGAPLSAARTTVRARHVVVAGGAINSPALLMRSNASDPYRLLGARTFLHPVVLSAAVVDQTVAGWEGAPQTIYSDHFMETDPIDGAIGYKLEAPPLHPLIFATSIGGYGHAMGETLKAFPNTSALIALLRDGFHPQSPGGRVELRRDGSPLLDYPVNRFLLDGARRAMLTMAEVQFAAGAKTVMVGHEEAPLLTSWTQAQKTINTLPMKPLLTRIVSAHVMGGCGMAGDERRGVLRPDGTHWQIENLSVHDGSIFPTSVGANPQLSIYGIVNRMATGLATRLAGRSVSLAT